MLVGKFFVRVVTANFVARYDTGYLIVLSAANDLLELSEITVCVAS